jgi:hypothetical protein
VIVAVVFALLFALALITPISELVALPPYYAANGIGDATPWPVLIAAVVVPVVLYLVALVLGRERAPFERALVLLVALAASFALHLAAVEFVLQTQPGF